MGPRNNNCNSSSTMINKFCQDIADFYEKFEQPYNGAPRFLEVEESAFRIKVHHEESHEYSDAAGNGDLEGQFDALIDLVYFALGTAYRQGFPFEKGWDRVHNANMAKMLAGTSDKSKRGFKMDVVKPEGWQAPILTDLLKNRYSHTPKLFIVEGPDACGKTTLAKELARDMGGIYWHMTATKHLTGEAQFDYQLNAIENIRQNLQSGKSVVLDRHWPSEYCYGSILRDITWEDVIPIRTAMDALNPYYIYCMDKNAETAMKRHKGLIDDAHPYSEEQYLAIYDSYMKFIMDKDKSYVGSDKMTVHIFDDSPEWGTKMLRFIREVRKAHNA